MNNAERAVPARTTGVTTTVCSPGVSIDIVRGDTQSTCGCSSTWHVYAATSEPPNRSSNRVAAALIGVTVNAVSAHTGGGGGGGAGGGADGGGDGGLGGGERQSPRKRQLLGGGDGGGDRTTVVCTPSTARQQHSTTLLIISPSPPSPSYLTVGCSERSQGTQRASMAPDLPSPTVKEPPGGRESRTLRVAARRREGTGGVR
jgi:hypothetical protein